MYYGRKVGSDAAGNGGRRISEFPELKGDSIVLKQSELADMIKRTSLPLTSSPRQADFTGMLVEAKDGEFAIVAVDGPRMAKKKIPFETVNEVRGCRPRKGYEGSGTVDGKTRMRTWNFSSTKTAVFSCLTIRLCIHSCCRETLLTTEKADSGRQGHIV